MGLLIARTPKYLEYVASGTETMLITISGLDGAGKSTLIKALAAELEKHSYRVAVIHLNHDIGVYACLQSLRDAARHILGRRSKRGSEDRLRGMPMNPPSHKNFTSRILWKARRAIIWNRPIRQAVFVADLFAFLLYRLWVEKMRGSILITDRYFYDRLVDLADGRRWTVIRLLCRCTPEPSVAVLVDVTPEIASARKGEYQLSYLQHRSQAYKRVFQWLRSPILLANDDLKLAISELETTVLKRMAA